MRDVIGGLDFFLFLNFFKIITVFLPLLLCLPQMCPNRSEEESQWESIPGTGTPGQEHQLQKLFSEVVIRL